MRTRAEQEYAFEGCHGSFEIFWFDGDAEPDTVWFDEYGEQWAEPGWYWWACFPGCLPDSDPMGPFNTSREALEDAEENTP